MEDNTKTSSDPSGQAKEPFHWTIDKVAACAKQIAEEHRTAKMWSDDLYKDLVLEYIKAEQFEKKRQAIFDILGVKHLVTVNLENLEDLIKFLYNYQHPQV